MHHETHAHESKSCCHDAGPVLHKDPVCGMSVEAEKARAKAPSGGIGGELRAAGSP